MNVINVTIDFEKGICRREGISVVTGDYNSTKVVFAFNDDTTGKTKMFEMKDPDDNLVYLDEIVDNEVILVGKTEEEGEEKIYSLFTKEGDYTFEVSLYGEDSKLTSVCDYITARKEEIVIGDGVIESFIPTFDNLINTITEKINEADEKLEQIDTAISEANNLNIDVTKVDKVATVDLTKKDGSHKQVQIRDGYDLEYDWQGTELGIKREDESNYEYVDLKGEKGDCNFATFSIVEGHLIMNKPEDMSQIDFRLDNRGHLVMEVGI